MLVLMREKETARERIERLVGMAYEIRRKDKALARRYIQIARNIGMRCNVRLPKEMKLYICKRCNTLLIPGDTCRVRVRPECGTKLALTCLECGAVKRIAGLKEQKRE